MRLDKRIKQILLVLGFLFLSSWGSANQNPSKYKEYIFGVVPQYPATEIDQAWRPFLTYLSKKIQVPIRLKLYESIPVFERSLLAGEMDLAFMNPYHVTMAHQRQGYVPLVHDGSRRLRGIIVVAKDSPIQRLHDLQNAAIAFPAPNAFGASLLVRRLLNQKGIVFTPEYVGTHSNVYRYVALGLVPAGGGVLSSLRKQPPALQKQLRILMQTPAVSPHPIAAHPRVAPEVRVRIIETIQKMTQDPEGQRLLDGVLIHRPVVSNYERDFAPVADGSL